MSVTLIRAYQGFAAGATATFPDSTEQALIAQGIASAGPVSSVPASASGQVTRAVVGGNSRFVPITGLGAQASYQGPPILPVIPLGSVALTTYEVNGVAPVAGTINLTEIYVPFDQVWTGAGVLNGTVVGTDSFVVGLYGTDGTRLANSVLTGTLSAGASVMQNIPFTAPVVLPAGRYFIAVQSSGITATLRHLVAANGANVCTSATAGVFGTLPTTLTPPATFTTAVGVISQLYV